MSTLLRCLALVALCAAFALELRTAGAQVDRAELDLALAVAKVAANEASLARVRPAEVALIWQVTESRAETAPGRLRWLRSHSSCVLTSRPIRASERRTNCRWSRGLADSDTRPAGWPARLAWSRFAPRWQEVREIARQLVAGELDMRPCAETPWTWGGRVDRPRALERGLVLLECRDPETGEPTLNDGYALRRNGGELDASASHAENAYFGGAHV